MVLHAKYATPKTLIVPMACKTTIPEVELAHCGAANVAMLITNAERVKQIISIEMESSAFTGGVRLSERNFMVIVY